MKALILKGPGSVPTLEDLKEKEVPGKECVELKASALNHRDVWITKGLYPGIKYPVILGSDGAGTWNGLDVLLNPSMDWGTEERFQDAHYHILGLPENGTFSEKVYVDKKYIFEKPQHLSFEEAAALPLAGLTAFRAMFTRANAQKTDHILITGAGGGVAMFAVQFALALGSRVFVTSGSREKVRRAMEMGAQGGVLYTDGNWLESLREINHSGFDVVIDGAGGQGLSELLSLCNPGARVVVYGGTKGKIGMINTQMLFWKQISLMGTTMGSDLDFEHMLHFVNEHKIRPVIDSVFDFSGVETAFARMEKSEQFGKIVFRNR